jgi:hypothetical protein
MSRKLSKYQKKIAFLTFWTLDMLSLYFNSPKNTFLIWGTMGRLKAVTMRLVLESFKSLVLAGFFWDFLWLFFTFSDFFLLFETVSFYIAKTSTLWRSHLWRFCDSLKAVTKKMVIESFESPSWAGFFVTICNLVYFYTSLAYWTDLLI